ncbi:hypothetical protein SUGI_0146190 [Cryptomeria japonica]|nr:hypothetical protein SUGI_0146190 [Cryptomeria japonica]
MEDGGLVFSVDDALLASGFGKYQWFLLFYAGMGWIAEAMEMMLLSFVGPAVHSEWGLTPGQESMITSVVFVGMMVGAALWGILSDLKGRKYGFFVTSVITFVAGFLSAFSPNYLALVCTRCFVGIGLGGGPVLSSWFLEFIPSANRGFWMVVFQVFWTIGTIIEASLAWIVMPKLGWRLLLGLSSGPSFVLLFFYGIVPESPRYLAMKGRTKDALHILENIALMNKKHLPAGRFVSQLNTELNEIDNIDPLKIEEVHLMNEIKQSNKNLMNRENENGVLSSLYGLFSPNFIKSTLLLWSVFFANAFTYYGLVLLTSELSGEGGNCGQKESLLVTSTDNSLYRDVFISSFGEFPGLVLSAIVVDYIGRKWSMAAMFFSCSVFLLPLIFPQHEAITTLLLFGARLCITGTFTIVYIYAPEVS